MKFEQLKKTGGARFKDVQTFKMTCDDPVHRILLTTTYKSGSEVGSGDAEFVHVSKGTLNKQYACVVKVHHSRNLFIVRELEIMMHMHDNINIVQYVCHFSCKDDRAKLMKPNDPYIPCKSGNDDLTFIIMEYVQGGDVGTFIKQCTDRNIILSMYVQVALSLIEMDTKYKVYHGDLNSGNILIKKAKNGKRSFDVDGKTYKVSTYGVRPVFIDFGRGGFYEKKSKNTKLIIEDVLVAWSVMTSWVQDVELKNHLNDLILKLGSSKRLTFDVVIQSIT
jgi:serine/threonine protein kinase